MVSSVDACQTHGYAQSQRAACYGPGVAGAEVGCAKTGRGARGKNGASEDTHTSTAS